MDFGFARFSFWVCFCFVFAVLDCLLCLDLPLGLCFSIRCGLVGIWNMVFMGLAWPNEIDFIFVYCSAETFRFYCS